MKKYRVAKKHSFYKTGCEFVKRDCEEIEFKSGWITSESEHNIRYWLKEGWIEEIQEPEFTKDDMIEFAKKCGCESPYIAYNMLNEWLKKYKDEKQTN